MAPTSVVGLFVKPLLDVMGEQNKTVQIGAAMCLAKVVECGGGDRGVGAVAFQKLCPRICKLLGGQSFVAKGALLSIISSLAQIGAISPHCMPTALQNIRECLENSDWAARKSAADALIVMASHSGHLIADGTSQIITSLEACRFDKVKPVRDSIMEALQLWKKVSGNDDDNAPEESIGLCACVIPYKIEKLIIQGMGKVLWTINHPNSTVKDQNLQKTFLLILHVLAMKLYPKENATTFKRMQQLFLKRRYPL